MLSIVIWLFLFVSHFRFLTIVIFHFFLTTESLFHTTWLHPEFIWSVYNCCLQKSFISDNRIAYLSPVWTFEVSNFSSSTWIILDMCCTEVRGSHPFFLAVSSKDHAHIRRCARFVRFEGCTVAIAVEVVGLMMLLRIRALYPHQKWIVKGLGILLVFETIMNIWLISRAEREFPDW